MRLYTNLSFSRGYLTLMGSSLLKPAIQLVTTINSLVPTVPTWTNWSITGTAVLFTSGLLFEDSNYPNFLSPCFQGKIVFHYYLIAPCKKYRSGNHIIVVFWQYFSNRGFLHELCIMSSQESIEALSVRSQAQKTQSLAHCCFS